MLERLLHWFGRVPRLVSFGRGDTVGDGDGSSSNSDDSDAMARRSTELGSGAVVVGEHGLPKRDELHLTDDLEAAVETIEHAKAKVWHM